MACRREAASMRAPAALLWLVVGAEFRLAPRANNRPQRQHPTHRPGLSLVYQAIGCCDLRQISSLHLLQRLQQSICGGDLILAINLREPQAHWPSSVPDTARSIGNARIHPLSAFACLSQRVAAGGHHPFAGKLVCGTVLHTLLISAHAHGRQDVRPAPHDAQDG